MAYTKRDTTKDGREFYTIRVSRGRGKKQVSMRWYIPDGWSQKAIDRELARVSRDFERQVQSGEIVSKAEQKEAQRAAEAELAQLKTMTDYFEAVFLPLKEVSCARSTVKLYKWVFGKFIKPKFGGVKMMDITSAQIIAFFTTMQKKDYAHKTVTLAYCLTHDIFRQALIDGTIESNPMDKVEPPKRRKEEKAKATVKAFTQEEVKYILDCMEQEPLKWRLIVWLLMETGIRRGECAAIQWKNIDFESNTILICGAAVKLNGEECQLCATKTGKERTVFFSGKVASMLKEYRKECKMLSPFVFYGANGRVMNPNLITDYFIRTKKKYSIKDFHPHKLRHTFASLALTNGADVVSVSEILGHSSTAMTLNIYSHATDESRKKAAAILRDAIGLD